MGSIPDSCLGDNRAHVLAWILDVVNEGFMYLLVPPEQMLGYYLKLGLRTYLLLPYYFTLLVLDV